MPIYKTNKKKDGLQGYRVKVNYTDNFGKRRQVERTAYGIEQAKDLERRLEKELEESKTYSRQTLKDLYDEYISVKQHEVRATSLKKIEEHISMYVLPLLGDQKIKKLTIPVLSKWKLEMESYKISVRTKNNIFSTFKAFLNYAVKMQYISANPLQQIGNFKDPYEIKEEMVYYTKSEFLKFRDAAKSEAERKGFTEWHYFVFFNIAFYTGMRKGEITALKWTDLSEDNVLHIRRSLVQKLKGGIVETPPKNKSSVRDIQLPTPLVKILNEHRDRCASVEGFLYDWRICGGPTYLPDSTIDYKNRFYASLAEIKNIRIHDYRHSHASLLANEGINIQEIARRLGHKKIEETWNTYSHLYPREEDRAVQILNKIT